MHFQFFHGFLALLDYVSRSHKIEIRPSVVRVTIISKPDARISFKFHLWLLPDNSQDQFVLFKKIFFFFGFYMNIFNFR